MTGVMAGFPVVAGHAGAVRGDVPEDGGRVQKAMGEAQQATAGDHALVVEILPAYTTIKPAIATQMAFDTFPLSLERRPSSSRRPSRCSSTASCTRNSTSPPSIQEAAADAAPSREAPPSGHVRG